MGILDAIFSELVSMDVIEMSSHQIEEMQIKNVSLFDLTVNHSFCLNLVEYSHVLIID